MQPHVTPPADVHLRYARPTLHAATPAPASGKSVSPLQVAALLALLPDPLPEPDDEDAQPAQASATTSTARDRRCMRQTYC
jgi:hypothetical protein